MAERRQDLPKRLLGNDEVDQKLVVVQPRSPEDGRHAPVVAIRLLEPAVRQANAMSCVEDVLDRYLVDRTCHEAATRSDCIG